MTSSLIQLSEDKFDDQYPLLRNHLNPNASWSYNDGPGCLFETYGEELEFVRGQDPSYVWTILDGDDDGQYLASGFHFVNRIGYLISTVPVPPEVEIEVRIPSSNNPEPEPEQQAESLIDNDPLFSKIARKQLGIPTLNTRKSDSLDFHDVAVWSVEAALRAAFEAGAQSRRDHSDQEHGLPTRFDNYEIHPCRRFQEDGDRIRFYYETCEPHEADIWTLYGHIPGQGIEAIGDFETREHALEVFARITGRRYERKA